VFTLPLALPSPAQGVWQLGPLPIRGYALCIIAGIIAAIWLGERRWVARGGEAGVISDIALWAVPFGIVGGRLYHVVTDPLRVDTVNHVLGLRLNVWTSVMVFAAAAAFFAIASRRTSKRAAAAVASPDAAA